ncbi:hypothetical protein CFOL_v3_17379 [Cephalotus follicularis]|uniref:Uncharacterized protein n=1 Tax=Cephalotus follicularis TaxID=3775 RepID=A0A1Q3C133_CEPFO|nr:hypothetical protein CFOL_v3_17379 [Cephalotus follicularis]
MGSEPNSPASLIKQRIRHSQCILCCFRKHHHNHHRSLNEEEKPALTRSSSSISFAWTPKSRRSHHHRNHETEPVLKHKCKNFISRICGGGGGGGGGGFGRHSRRHSADFKYDALSYALNFDEGDNDDHFDECPFRSFSSRLPPSPNREITACS